MEERLHFHCNIFSANFPFGCRFGLLFFLAEILIQQARGTVHPISSHGNIVRRPPSMTERAVVDTSYPNVTLTRIAFGSCHSRGAVNARLVSEKNKSTKSSTKNSIADDNDNIDDGGEPQTTIWDAISTTIHPQTFLWTGDAIYPPMKIKGDTPLDIMKYEYEQMLHNETLGYARFLHKHDLVGGVHGTWDDHDYGGNDRGYELPQREERRDAYLEFLGVPHSSERWTRQGLYSSVQFGSDTFHDSNNRSNPIQKEQNGYHVKVIFLDTRWHRAPHCIPSVGSTYIPFGAIISCVTRWLTAGLNLPSIVPSWLGICPNDGAVLGEDQWAWLNHQLQQSSASLHVVVSSIQVLTTNPVVESWGHFPKERDRLLKLLNGVKGLVLLSGDVHHAEISTSSQQKKEQANDNKYKNSNGNIGQDGDATKYTSGSIVEVTSSGLSHSCAGPFYGRLCRPILDAFPNHRFRGGNVMDVDAPSYFTMRNFGSIDIDWVSRTFTVNVHDEGGDLVLSTGSLQMDTAADMTHGEVENIIKCIDGHFLPFVGRFTQWSMAVLVALCLYYIFSSRSRKFNSKMSTVKHDKEK